MGVDNKKGGCLHDSGNALKNTFAITSSFAGTKTMKYRVVLLCSVCAIKLIKFPCFCPILPCNLICFLYALAMNTEYPSELN